MPDPDHPPERPPEHPPGLAVAVPAPHPDLHPDEILARLRELVGEGRVLTDPARLREVSQDRWKKYQSVHGIHDGPQPLAMVRVASTDEVAAVLRFAHQHRVPVVPRTGGTGTEGGLEVVLPSTVVLDGSPMDDIVSIDERDMQATARCGTPLRVLEEALRERGLTTGHSPQSQPLAQLGGLVATRSIGQLSTLYGGIEDMVVGIEAVLAGGEVVRVRDVPRRAAGPDVRHVLIGNEGALAFVTEVTLKVFRAPERRRYQGFLVDGLDTGIDLLRAVVTAGHRPAVARVYDAGDAAQHFDFADGRCVVALMTEGPRGVVEATAAAVDEVAEAMRAESAVDPVPPEAVGAWFEGLNWGPEKLAAEQESMLASPRLGFTTEVAATWSRIGPLYDAVMTRVRDEFERFDDLVLLGAHSSHSYQNGTNLYFVYDYEARCAVREELETYHWPLHAIIVEESLRAGGTMVHHHGVGKYRTDWVEREHGSSYRLLRGLKRELDPRNVMNPGTIFPLA